jgi:hypothetical protein
MNLFVSVGAQPPELDALREWVAAQRGETYARVSKPTPAQASKMGLTISDLLVLATAFKLPRPLSLATLPDHLTARDVFPSLLRSARSGVLFFTRCRYRGRVYGHAAVASGHHSDEWIEIHGGESMYWHARLMPYTRGRVADLREALFDLRHGRAAHGCLSRLAWDTVPAEASAFVNGSRTRSPRGIERHFLLCQ